MAPVSLVILGTSTDMDNQHKLIQGYRDLSQGEINSINKLKEMEADIGIVLAHLDDMAMAANNVTSARWASIARTHLEIGFMFAIKAVACPTNGLGVRN